MTMMRWPVSFPSPSSGRGTIPSERRKYLEEVPPCPDPETPELEPGPHPRIFLAAGVGGSSQSLSGVLRACQQRTWVTLGLATPKANCLRNFAVEKVCLIWSSSTIDKKLENFEFIFEFKIAINFEFIFEIFVNYERDFCKFRV